MFFSTPFEELSAKFLNDIGLEIFKIPSGEITNLPLLQLIAKFNKDIILSTGMSTLEEVSAAISVIKNQGHTKKISILHCTTEYPAPFNEINLNAIGIIREFTNLEVGYSDHTMGLAISFAAVGLGATIIEKHFTLSREMYGPDHQSSLEPHELKELVDGIRNIEFAMGSGEKVPTPSENKNIIIARKSIVAKNPIKKGEVFTIENLTAKRPGTGVSPMKFYDYIGQFADKDYEKDEQINER